MVRAWNLILNVSSFRDVLVDSCGPVWAEAGENKVVSTFGTKRLDPRGPSAVGATGSEVGGV